MSPLTLGYWVSFVSISEKKCHVINWFHCIIYVCFCVQNILVAWIPQCTSHIPHNAPFCSRNVHVCTVLLQNGALWYICQMHFGICEIGLLMCRRYSIQLKTIRHVWGTFIRRAQRIRISFYLIFKIYFIHMHYYCSISVLELCVVFLPQVLCCISMPVFQRLYFFPCSRNDQADVGSTLLGQCGLSPQGLFNIKMLL